jgi:hypothetical protein
LKNWRSFVCSFSGFTIDRARGPITTGCTTSLVPLSRVPGQTSEIEIEPQAVTVEASARRIVHHAALGQFCPTAGQNWAYSPSTAWFGDANPVWARSSAGVRRRAMRA